MTRAIPPPPFEEMMKRWHGEIGQKMDAASQHCKEIRGYCKNTGCDFYRPGYLHPCKLTDLEIILEVRGYAVKILEPIRPPDLYPHGEDHGKEIYCRADDHYEYQQFERDHTHLDPVICGRESAALALSEEPVYGITESLLTKIDNVLDPAFDISLRYQIQEIRSRGIIQKQSAEREQKDGECSFGQSYDNCKLYRKCEECLKKEPTWLEKHDAVIRAAAKAEGAKEEREKTTTFLREFVATHISDGDCPFGKMNSPECLEVRGGQCETCIIDHAIESLRSGEVQKE